MAAKPNDSTIVASFKATIVISLKERFDMTSVDIAKHPFVVATVLDPEYKGMAQFPDNIRAAAYANVSTMAATMPLPVQKQDQPAASISQQPPPEKRTKVAQDCRNAARRFLGAQQPPGGQVCDVQLYVAAPSTQPAGGLLDWWKQHIEDFPQTSELARRYLAVPATSTQSERLFSATGRIVSKLRTRLLPERVEALVFL